MTLTYFKMAFVDCSINQPADRQEQVVHGTHVYDLEEMIEQGLLSYIIDYLFHINKFKFKKL